MTGSRKIIVYMATSVDGYIARKDGNADWLNRPRPAGDYGMGAFLKTIDTIVWGRKTYDMAAGFSKKGGGLGYGPRIKNYVFTHHPPAAAASGVEFITEPVNSFAQSLKAEPGKGIWIMGGAGIVGSFLDAGQIDEFMIHVVPTIIGEGIPLVAPARRLIPLTLRSAEGFSDGVVCLHYTVDVELAHRKKTRGNQRRQAR